MIKLVRVDHRLLHGQVIFSWTKQVGTNYIIVADDKVPNDPISMMALSIACEGASRGDRNQLWRCGEEGRFEGVR